MTEEYLEHFGVIGMKWRQHKARKAEKTQNAYMQRVAVIERTRKKNPYIDTDVMNDYMAYGKKLTNNVLDKMAKDPSREYNSTMNREYIKHAVNRALLVFGATVIGTGLSMIE